ncbi:hypothetical protein MCOR25_008044 [Pyricularia grisea]|uniref:Uncharacterized protein n=1 Tax=Pyricularia grisea TaxID=148305 RepID=A0A6P8B464_PYRGI|nr:hypothetical protein PgNI_05775 [Pyricularia grisea]KAI6355961.1 hypothetical protein MCOR25_008044 [Pyricularia grisea]TLD10092.1 hypothetical protein PgNI_05775 [Pyricularia grisea]
MTPFEGEIPQEKTRVKREQELRKPSTVEGNLAALLMFAKSLKGHTLSSLA